MSQLAHALRTRRSAIRLAGALVLAALVASALVWMGRAEGGPRAGAATTVSNVATGRADAVDAADFTCTTSLPFVDMPGMSETFSFGGTASRPVLVLFEAEWQNTAEGWAVIRLLIDGVAQPGPGGGLSVHEDDATQDLETNGFNFISAPLAPGTHTAKIQWRPAGAPRICVSARSLIVVHK